MSTTSQDFSLIKTFVDKYFDFMDGLGENVDSTEYIPAIMIDPNRKGDEYSSYWLAIASTVTDTEIGELEALLQHPLPDSFKFLLKYRHFIDLYPGEEGFKFFGNMPQRLVQTYKKNIDIRYKKALERNYLPFAHFMDIGVLCFDANAKVANNDYPIVLLKNRKEGYNEQEFYANNFLEMFKAFDAELDDLIKTNLNDN